MREWGAPNGVCEWKRETEKEREGGRGTLKVK